MKRLVAAVVVGIVMASFAGANDLSREARRWMDVLKWRGCISTIASRDGASVEIRDYDGNGIADIVVRARRIKSRKETLRCIASAVAERTSHATWRPDKVVVFMYGPKYERAVCATVEKCRRCEEKDGQTRKECFEEIWEGEYE